MGRACLVNDKNARSPEEASIFKIVWEAQALAAARPALIDRLAEQAATDGTKQGAKRPVAARVDGATGERTSASADDQTRGAIIALAAIAALIVAPHAIIS